MTPAAFETACLALPAATLSIQWGDDHVFKVGGKMFAVLGGAVGGHDGVSFKVSDLAYEVMSETGPGRPAPYLARAKWMRFDDLSALDEAEVADWLKTAHALVSAKLTRAMKRELGL